MDFKSGDEAAMGLDLDTQDTVGDTAPTEAKKPEKAVSMAKQDKGSDELVAEKAGEAMAGAGAPCCRACAAGAGGREMKMQLQASSYKLQDAGNGSALRHDKGRRAASAGGATAARAPTA